MQLYERLRLKLKKINCVLELNQSPWLKSYIEFIAQQGIEAEKSEGKDGKALYKLRNNAIFGKTMENLINKINLRLVINEKHYLKCSSKPSYMSHKIFENI